LYSTDHYPLLISFYKNNFFNQLSNAYFKQHKITKKNFLFNKTTPFQFGDNVRLGPHVYLNGSIRKFMDRNTPIVDQGHEHAGLTVGSDVLVGASAVIMAGVVVGDGAVIGAGAVVNRNVPPYSIVAGVPAKVIGERQ
jgi:acetyltransferase-like isoleucine patch superfamily enzyme